MSDVPSMLDHALAYQEHGLSVVPLHSVVDGRCSCQSRSCGKPGKHPRIQWRSIKARPLSREQIEEYWTRWPDANIGVVTGKQSGIAVLDIDGPEGIASLEEVGIPLTDLPPTPSAETGGGGLHFYYRMPEDERRVKTSAGVLEKVDIRAEGGLIVMPPSLHGSGRRYAWQDGRSVDEVDFADFDFALLNAEAGESIAPARELWFERLLEGVSHGARNGSLTRLAGRYFHLGMTEREVLQVLLAWNSRNDPPIDAAELRRTVRSVRDKEYEKGSKEDLLTDISDVLKSKVDRIKVISGDEPKIVMEFDTGTATLTHNELLSPKTFQTKIGAATNVFPRRFGAKTVPTIENLGQMILNAAEEVDSGDEATGQGELWLMLNDFVESQSSLPEVDPKDAPIRGSFIVDGYIWISLPDLIQRVKMTWGTNLTMASTAQMMRMVGNPRRTFQTSGGGTRSMWGVEVGRFPFIQSPPAEEEEEAA